MLSCSVVVAFCIFSHTTGWNFGSICSYHLSALIVVATFEPTSGFSLQGSLIDVQNYRVCLLLIIIMFDSCCAKKIQSVCPIVNCICFIWVTIMHFQGWFSIVYML